LKKYFLGCNLFGDTPDIECNGQTTENTCIEGITHPITLFWERIFIEP
jgi:hypothetical protein